MCDTTWYIHAIAKKRWHWSSNGKQREHVKNSTINISERLIYDRTNIGISVANLYARPGQS